MLRATEDGIETPVTYLQLLQQTVDIANSIVADCEGRGLAAWFEDRR